MWVCTLHFYYIISICTHCGASPMAQQVKNPPAVQEPQEMQVCSLGWEDPMEKEMAIPSSTLAWEIHGQKSLVGYGPRGCRVGHDSERLSTRARNLCLSYLFSLLH